MWIKSDLLADQCDQGKYHGIVSSEAASTVPVLGWACDWSVGNARLNSSQEQGASLTMRDPGGEGGGRGTILFTDRGPLRTGWDLCSQNHPWDPIFCIQKVYLH